MLQALIGPIASIIARVVDKAIPDRDQAERLKAELLQQMLTTGQAELQGAIDIVLAEARGESWLQRNWRPLLMLVCIVIIANNYILAPYMAAMFRVSVTLELPEALWNLMTLGVGGYIGGRTIEKAVQAWKAN